MVLSVKLNPAVGASQGRPLSAIASYVWRPDLGSMPFARRSWQAAGGVRGLVMANYFTGANGGGIHLPVMDTMGNVTQVVRAGVQLNYNGESMRSEFVYDYDAFGKETRSSTLVAGLNPDSFPFHFSTKFTDPESGFNYYGYRFYDPANGRWINRDPIGERGGLNLYGMCFNDPVNALDVNGGNPIIGVFQKILGGRRLVNDGCRVGDTLEGERSISCIANCEYSDKAQCAKEGVTGKTKIAGKVRVLASFKCVSGSIPTTSRWDYVSHTNIDDPSVECDCAKGLGDPKWTTKKIEVKGPPSY
jgi:RHS repeat-associated protein